MLRTEKPIYERERIFKGEVEYPRILGLITCIFSGLKAALEMKRNFIRVAKGRDNRIGHNWEAVAEWFIDSSRLARLMLISVFFLFLLLCNLPL